MEFGHLPWLALKNNYIREHRAELRVCQLPFGAVKSHSAVPRTQPHLQRAAFEVECTLLFDLIDGVGRRQHLNANLGRTQPTNIAAMLSDRCFGGPDDIRNLGTISGFNRKLDDRLAITEQISENPCDLALKAAVPRMGRRHDDLIKPIELDFERKIVKVRISAYVFPGQFFSDNH